jgi:methylmalonyl-CoA mutase, N-terminal domain
MNIIKPPGTFSSAQPGTPSDVGSETARWKEETFGPAEAGKKGRKKYVTDTGIPVEPLYTPAHLEQINFDYLRDLGFPGEYPFTRGDRPGMNRTDPFVVSAYSGF